MATSVQKHFELTSESKVDSFGGTLFRVKLTIDCKWGKAGDLGGWVQEDENIQGFAWVSDNAWVSGNAQVYGDAQISGNAWV
ncbi:MAG TPA: polymer-forming cytoskeletal protein, partial [Candidatus Dojkabacteria bacterium]|nr:polymer-forming cytoskeletal protein [Candidatus Dojkabacteria bacterium]